MRRVLLLAPLLAVLAACGSTVHIGEQDLAGGSVAGDGLSLTPSVPSTAPTMDVTTGPTDEPLASDEPTTVLQTQSDDAPTPIDGGGSTSTSTSKIVVGFYTESDDSALAGSLALSGVSNGDEPGYMHAVVNDLNKHGGILGRQVSPVEHQLDPSTTSSYATIEQEVCTDFYEDHHVTAVLTAFHNSPDQGLAACVERHHGAVVDPVGYSNAGGSDFAKYPHYYSTSGLSLERQSIAYIDGLVKLGFFPKGSRIGLLGVDLPQYRSAISTSLVPELKKHGLIVASTAYWNYPSSTAGIGAAATSIASAQLKFASARVDRVLFLEGGALGVYEFMLAAQTQGYHPQYGISTTDAPNGLIGLGAPKAQLQNAVGVGWYPLSDVGHSNEKPNAAATRCSAVMKAAGAATPDDTTLGVAREYCEELWFLKAAMEAGGGTSAAAIQDGVTKLGTSFESPQVGVTHFSAGRHYGASQVRPLGYVTSCSCFRYSGPAEKVS